MKISRRLAPLFAAAFALLPALAPAAFAQIAVRRAAVAPVAPVAGVAPSALSAPAAALAPAVPFAAAPAALGPVFAAPSAAPEFRPQDLGTPGPAAGSLAREAASYAAQPAADAPRKGAIARLVDVVLQRVSLASLFDSSSAKEIPTPIVGRVELRQHEPIVLPNGSTVDQHPSTPVIDVSGPFRQSYSVPGSQPGGVSQSPYRTLSADPSNTDAVVAAVKAMIDENPSRYGVSSANLQINHVKKFEGVGEQADSFYVYFRQTKDGVTVHGHDLSFTIKVIDGKPVVVAQPSQPLAPVDVNTGASLSDEQIMAKIAQRTGLTVPQAAGFFRMHEEKIVHSRGEWHHVKVYASDALPYMVAVDLATGRVFVWDNRAGSELTDAEAPAGPAAGATVAGKGVRDGPVIAGAKIEEIPLAFLSVNIGGKDYVTDENGRLPAAASLDVGAGLTLTTSLAGPYVRTSNNGKPIKIGVKIKAGDSRVVLNPDSTLNDEEALANINGFYAVNLAYFHLKQRKLTTDQMDKNPILLTTNVNKECNAYYTPGRPSLNTFKASVNCVNSAYLSVLAHEYGHYWDDMTGGIKNGALSESWGDTLSMYMRNDPIVGEHFMKTPRNGTDYIRTGENTYQYNDLDEVHKQGQAFGGFTWKLRLALKKELGDAAGEAMADALVFPTMFAKASTIPDAIAQVFVNATKRDGAIQFEQIIRDTAKIHGIELPDAPGQGDSGKKGLVATLVSRALTLLGLV